METRICQDYILKVPGSSIIIIIIYFCFLVQVSYFFVRCHM